MPFSNPLALLGLLSLVPLIIIYLIRPRPKEVLFSSSLFLPEGEAERSAVLSRLITDPLFWIQALILIALSTAAAGPYTLSEGTPSTHLAIVMDVSASMDGGFQQALNTPEPYLDSYSKVSIVLAENIPAVTLQDGSPTEARDTLAKITPKAVTSDLSGAMNLARGLLGTDGGNILVVSDFRGWLGDDPEDTRKLLESKPGISVVFAKTSTGGDNVALVGGWSVPSGSGYVNHTAQVHNYGSARQVPITVSGPGGSSTRAVSLAKGQDYYFSFNAVPGINIVSLGVNDAVSSDNRAYIYVPGQRQTNVLYLGEDEPSLIALQSLPSVKVEKSGDPLDFDVVVASKNSSTDGALNRYVDGGGKIVYVAYNDNESPDYLPAKINGRAAGPVNLWQRSQEFAGDIHFDEIGVQNYLDAAPRRQSQTLVEANGAPVLAYWRLGKGMVVYNGLEYDSDFYVRPEYPIFWYETLNWLLGVPDILDSNKKTGDIVPLGETLTVDTPSGGETTSNLLMDDVGIYRYRDTTLAASMYNPQESDLTGDGASYPSGQFSMASAREAQTQNDLSPWVILLGAVLIIGEMALVWWRREA